MTYTHGRRVTHCPYCGSPYGEAAGWPRDCSACGETQWFNPLPVAVAMLPVVRDGRRGLVVVRRAIEPCLGELVLPGGYIEAGESWQRAAVRELREESGLEAEDGQVSLFAVHSSQATLNVFALLPAREERTLPPSAPTEEATEWLVLRSPAPLAFPSHTAAVTAYFAGEGPKDAQQGPRPG